MKVLILVHVLSSIIGIGPTFFLHVLFRKNQSLPELKQNMKLGKTLIFFPKIGGLIAVITGIILVFIGNYGPFMQVWLFGSLVLFIIIQVINMGFVAPKMKQLAGLVMPPKENDVSELSEQEQHLLTKISNLFWAASTFGVTIFILMILKP